MKYIVFDELIKGNGGWDHVALETNDLDEALEEASLRWGRPSDKDRENRCVYVLVSENPDEEAENHYDGDYAAYYSNELFDEYAQRHYCDVIEDGTGVYTLIEQAYGDNYMSGTAYYACAIRRGDPIIDGEIPTYMVTWTSVDETAENEEDACDWLNPDEISLEQGVVNVSDLR